MDRKSGVGPNGENCSALEEEARAARYGRFQCMNLGYSLAAFNQGMSEGSSYTLLPSRIWPSS
jgi:hypothetical protein